MAAKHLLLAGFALSLLLVLSPVAAEVRGEQPRWLQRETPPNLRRPTRPVAPETLWNEARQAWGGGRDTLSAAPGFWTRSLLPIGFSRTGAFAWLDGGRGGEVDCPHASVVVQDLSSDRVLGTLALIDETCPHPERFGGVPGKSEVVALLDRFGIDGRPIPTLVPQTDPLPTYPLADLANSATPFADLLIPFPLISAGEDGFSVELAQRPRRPGDRVWPGYAAEEAVVEVSLRSTNLGAKVLGTVPAAGSSVLAGPSAAGAFISPWEPRIALVLTWYDHVLESSAGVLDHAILGAKLDQGFEKPQR